MSLKGIHKGLFVCAIVVATAWPAGLAKDASDQPTEVPRDEIAGVVYYPDGVTPISGLPIRVWSVDKEKILYRSQTDQEGVFHVPATRSGRCYLFVGRIRVNLQVMATDESEWHQRHDLVVILPHRMRASAIPFVPPIIPGMLKMPVASP